MNQTKLESLIESICNNGSAFIISLMLWAYVVGPLYDKGIIESAFSVTICFTIVSLIRTYLWRRFFNAGLHRLISKFIFRNKVIKNIELDYIALVNKGVDEELSIGFKIKDEYKNAIFKKEQNK